MKKVNLLYGLALAILIMSCRQEKQAEANNSGKTGKVRVQTIMAKESNATELLNYSGIITPTVTTRLSFQLPGNVARIYIKEGDKIKKGQILAELDKTSYESTYKAALAMKKQAQDAYDRLHSVYKKGSLPEIKWEEVKSKFEQANSAEIIAKNNLENCKIVAPSDGVIGSRSMEIGTSVMPGIPVIDLISIDDVFVRISVPENEINKIRKDQTATVKIPATGEDEYTGKVETIGVMANQISKTYTVQLRVKNKNHSIRPGMVCDVNLSIPTGNNTVLVPIQAILKDVYGNEYVFIVDKQSGKAGKVIVKPGSIRQNEVQVLKGISKGQLVVIKGQHKLDDQNPVIYDQVSCLESSND